MQETLYYCPGVQYKRKGDKIFFLFVRAEITSKKVNVDLVSISDKKGNQSVTFPFQPEQKKIELIDSSGKSLGTWER